MYSYVVPRGKISIEKYSKKWIKLNYSIEGNNNLCTILNSNTYPRPKGTKTANKQKMNLQFLKQVLSFSYCHPPALSSSSPHWPANLSPSATTSPLQFLQSKESPSRETNLNFSRLCLQEFLNLLGIKNLFTCKNI